MWKTGPAVLAGGLVLLGLYATSRYSFLLFHSLAEIFSVLVAFVIFVLVWNTRRVLDNQYLLFIGIASFFAGALDLAHTLAYKGMGVFPGYDTNLPTQLWIAFRLVFSLAFLIAPFFLNRRISPEKTFIVFLLITAGLLAAIFLGHFPACYVEGAGLTIVKKYTEYAIIVVFLAALGLLFRHRDSFNPGVLRLLMGALLGSVISELSFTLYVNIADAANVIGHFFELLSYYLIYKAIVVTGIAEPSAILFRNLKLSEEKIRESEERYRSLVELSPDAIAVRCEGKYVYINDAGVKLFGAKHRDEITGRDSLELLHPDFHKVVSERTDQGRDRKARSPLRESKILRLDGTSVDVEAASTPVTYNGKPATQVVIHDITERKRAEEALRASETRYRALFDNMIEGFALHRIVLGGAGKPVDYVFLEINSAFERLTGLMKKNIVGRRVTEVMPGIENDPADWIGVYGKVAVTGEDIEFEQFSRDQGKWFFVSAYSPMKGHFAVVFQDITERKKAESESRRYLEELRASNEELARFNRSMVDRELRMIELKKEVNRLCGEAGESPRYALDFEQQEGRLES